MRPLLSISQSIKPMSFTWLNGILVGFFIVYHLLTLPISPLPWFDEVAFASITHNVMSKGKMIWPEVSEQEEFLAYGPVYFYVQHFLMKLLGFGIYSFRLLNLLSGLSLVAISYFMLKHLRFGSYWALLMATLLLVDVIFNQNLHSGRMDLFALFLGMISYVIFYFPWRSKLLRIYLSPALSGVVFSLAYLSTPRSIYLVAGFATLFIYQSFTRSYNVVIRYIFMSIIVCIIVGSWILIKFDSIPNYINYYLNDPIVSRHIGGFSLVRYSHHWPITILLLMAIMFGVINWKSLKHKELFIFAVSIIISFSLLVKEIGPYSAMIMPFYYFLVVIIIVQSKGYPKSTMHLFVYVVLLINTGVFILKAGLIAVGLSDRAFWKVNREIQVSIPKDSNVVADYRYYYALKRHGCEYRMLRSGRRELQDRAIFFVNDFRADYLILTDTTDSYSRRMLDALDTLADREHVGHIMPDLDLRGSAVYNQLKRFGYTIDNSYRGSIYKLIYKNGL